MPINTKHPSYTNNIDKWNKCRDTYAGEEAIKDKNETYLPLLSSMSSASDKKYIAYKNRAMFYAATARTVDGLVGMVLRKPIQDTIPDKYENYKIDITTTGISLENFVKQLLSEVTLTARAGILVDHNGERSYTVLFPTENIINWRVDEETGKPTMIVLLEYEEIIDPDDKFSIAVKEVYRELYIDEETGKYNVSLWRKKDTQKDEYEEEKLDTPTVRGKTMDEIPFIFITPEGTDSDIQKPLLLDMINVNLSHYRTSADLEHGRHFTALPTPYVFGVRQVQDKEGNVTPINIGSETCIVSEESGGSAGYMEFTGQGLSALERAMTEKSEYMAILGATMLQVQKKAAEAADTVRLNRSGDSSSMISVISSCESAMNQALQYMINWESIVNEGSVTVDINKDLLDSTIDPQTITALVSSWQGGAISHETLLHNFQKGEILPDDIDIEEELNRIDEEAPDDEGEALDLTPEEKRKNLKIVKNEDDSYDVTETTANG